MLSTIVHKMIDSPTSTTAIMSSKLERSKDRRSGNVVKTVHRYILGQPAIEKQGVIA